MSVHGAARLEVCLRPREHRHNLQQDLLEKSELAQHAYEEGHKVGWDDARILEIESNSRYRKYKESAHMACLTNPTSQPSLDISPIWIPLITQSEELYDDRFFICFHKVSVFECSGFIPQMALVVGTTCLSIFPLFLCIGAHALDFVS
jgi:hypothetical protein